MKASQTLSEAAGDMRGFAKAAFELAQIYLVDGDVAGRKLLRRKHYRSCKGPKIPGRWLRC